MSATVTPMNRVIDAGSGLIVTWETTELVETNVMQLTFPAEFTATAGGVVMEYANAQLRRVSGEDIDLASLVPLDRRARELVAHTPDGELVPPTFDAPVRKPSRSQYIPEFLREVAEAFASGGYQGVQDKFAVGRRQASRYIARARDAGMIER